MGETLLAQICVLSSKAMPLRCESKVVVIGSFFFSFNFSRVFLSLLKAICRYSSVQISYPGEEIIDGKQNTHPQFKLLVVT